jgi:hypothetical protein
MMKKTHLAYSILSANLPTALCYRQNTSTHESHRELTNPIPFTGIFSPPQNILQKLYPSGKETLTGWDSFRIKLRTIESNVGLKEGRSVRNRSKECHVNRLQECLYEGLNYLRFKYVSGVE